LLDDDREGWKEEKVSPVSICLREGNPGFNLTSAERTFSFRDEAAWPLPSTMWEKWHINETGDLGKDVRASNTRITYPALR
jgi:hypothetical protein